MMASVIITLVEVRTENNKKERRNNENTNHINSIHTQKQNEQRNAIIRPTWQTNGNLPSQILTHYIDIPIGHDFETSQSATTWFKVWIK